MFRVINFSYLIRSVAVATTIISVFLYLILRYFVGENLQITKIINIVPWVSIAIIFLLTAAPVARFIWFIVSKINKSLYPDLNGVWEGKILPGSGKNMEARAIICQTLLHARIDLHTETSKSFSLETTPAMEGGQFKLYYTYQSKPKNPDWSAYTGVTIFDIRSPSKDPARPLELSGYYFTSRKTNGRILLRRVSGEINTDVSYY